MSKPCTPLSRMLQGSPGYRPKDCRRVVADDIQPNATNTHSKPMEQGQSSSVFIKALQSTTFCQRFSTGASIHMASVRFVAAWLFLNRHLVLTSLVTVVCLLLCFQALVLATSTRTQAATESPDDVDFDAGPSVYKLFHFMWYIY